MNTRPLPLTRDSVGAVAGTLRSALSRPLSGVVYAMPEGSRWERESEGQALHCVEMALSLDFAGIGLRIDWAQDGWNEGLAMLSSSELPSEWSLRDVRNEPEWTEFTDTDLLDVAFVWHRAETRADETVLAVRFEFANGRGFLVALGQCADGEPSYLPDEIVVVFDDSVAAGYLAGFVTSTSHGLGPLG